MNEYSLDLIKEDFDIIDNSKKIFEYRNNSNKKVKKVPNIEIKNNILNKRIITNNNIQGLQIKSQNSYEFFKMLKKKK